MKKYITIIAIIILSIGLSSCDPSPSIYGGSRPDLYSVAANSILGINGVGESDIAIVQTDSYGRTMFVYLGDSLASKPQMSSDRIRILSIMIAQKNDKEYVYYYPDYNFIIYNRSEVLAPEAETKEILIQFANSSSVANDVEWLKKNNDWEKPIDESKCVKAMISKTNIEKDSDYQLVPENIKEELCKIVDPESDSSLAPFIYHTSDDYDRHVYYFRIRAENSDEFLYKESYVVIFNPDGSYDIENGVMELVDFWNYQDDMKVFKERNGWNTPIS